jgi:hypothetical protein
MSDADAHLCLTRRGNRPQHSGIRLCYIHGQGLCYLHGHGRTDNRTSAGCTGEDRELNSLTRIGPQRCR